VVFAREADKRWRDRPFRADHVAHSKDRHRRCVPAPHPKTQGSTRGPPPAVLGLFLNTRACRARGRDRYRRRKAGVISNYVGKVLNWLFETVQSLFPQGALMSGFRPQFRQGGIGDRARCPLGSRPEDHGSKVALYIESKLEVEERRSERPDH
jgi:hypothetical protein